MTRILTTHVADHRAASGLRTVVIAQIEDVEAVAAGEAFPSVDGIEALFIGQIDLTIALGRVSPDDPEGDASACEFVEKVNVAFKIVTASSCLANVGSRTITL